MATHPSVDASRKSKKERVFDGRAFDRNRGGAIPAQPHCTEAPLFRAIPTVAPVAVIPQALSNPRTPRRNLRRVMTREEGRALETIGHAVDYLNDSYLYEGDEKEFLHVDGGSMMQALGILASARIEVLRSLRLEESTTTRLWNAFSHRILGRAPERSSHRGSGSESQQAGVIPLSSSR